jgi:MoaA/NifB/PqqE/SkfB family radical SAM enzyme
MVDTNGWLLTKDKAFELKHLGVDKIQVGLDSLNKEEHDTFRNKEGAFYHAIDAIENVNKAGLVLQVSTVVPKERIRSVEFEEFLKFTDGVGACVNAILPKPVGAWENYDPNITEEDLKYMDELSEKYNVSVHHRSIHFGIKLGCIAVKKIISINSYGDVMPCIWMYASLGNIFETPLRQILEKGMKHFGGYRKTCNMSEDTKFIEKYRNVTKGKDLPIEIEDLIC